MDIFAPSYYKNFKCIAQNCKNNCCIGWEIDIDNTSLSYYKDKYDIFRHISLEGVPHFIMDKNGRCPLLDEKNLCEIIKNYGENHLCQICSDHPRFRNYYDTRTEIGLGLTCEEAAKLIIDNKFTLEKIGEDDGIPFPNEDEADFFILRDKYLYCDFSELKKWAPDITVDEISRFLKGLERLDNKWDIYLNELKNTKQNIKDIEITDVNKAENLFSYFVFRHLYETDIQFCLVCTLIVLAKSDDIYESARMFSSEIEYSDENIERLYSFIKNKS